ncbi:MAG: NADH-quinone oxidoreductase subunit L [Pseudomonadota bacterium]
MYYKLILLLPLLAAAISGGFQKQLGVKLSQLIPTVTVSFCALCSVYVFFADMGQAGEVLTLFSWIDMADLHIGWEIRTDALTRMMLPVVTVVSALVHIYSFGYMADDPSKPRFFSYLSLFTFMMLALVTSNNFLQMFFGWEGVGLASYLLIGYYFHKESACAASMKAFVVNRVADFTLILGLALIFFYVGSFDYDVVFAAVQDLKAENIMLFGQSFVVLDVICVCLFLGAMGKSAQFFLHTWLPDAMEGPTPVSALIHAATMVTAGVFLVTRASHMYEFSSENVQAFIIVIGMVTSLFAATVGMTQFDIKRVIAYSTCSQLGYMFFAAGVGAYQAAVFHLFTHAFFKAMLFLGAGSVIHAMHHEQDMRNMGGLYQKIKPTAWLMIIGTIAITGIGIPFVLHHGIGFSGFHSKDMIIEAAAASPRPFAQLAFFVGVFVAFLTAFYSWRLIFLVFFGAPRGNKDTHAHAHEAPAVMTLPVTLLGFGAIFAGYMFYGAFVGHDMGSFWGNSIFNQLIDGKTIIDKAHYVPWYVKISPLIASLSGLLIAWLLYILKPDVPAMIASDFKFFYRFLFKKWYFDEIYNAVFVGNYKRVSQFFAAKFDYGVIDNMICGFSSWKVRALGVLGREAHTGYLYHYAYAMFLGVVVMLFVIIVG